MTAIACGECRTEVPAGARNCPACAAPVLANFMPDPRLAAARARRASEHTGRNILIGIVIVLGCLALLARCASFFGEVSQRADARKEAGALADTSRELLLAEKRRLDDADNGGAPAQTQALPANPAPATIAPATNAAELLRGMNRIVRELHARNLRDQIRLQAEVAALQLETVLSPQNLTDARGIADGQAAMRRYLGLVEAAYTATRADRIELDRRIYTLAGDTALSARFIQGYEQSKSQRVALENAQVANQRRVVAATQALLGFAHSRLGRISLDRGELLFRSQSDLDTYQRLLADFDREAALEQDIANRQRKMIDEALVNAEQLKAL